MSEERHRSKSSPPEAKSEREILELRVDVKMAETKQALLDFNRIELQRIASNIHEPKLKRVRNWSALIIAILVAGHIAEWFGVKERVKSEAEKVINQKLIDPQLTNTLDEALSKKAIPFIAAQVHPIETNVAAIKTNLQAQAFLFEAMTLDISNRQAKIISQQVAIRNQLQPLSNRVVLLQSSVEAAQEKATNLQAEQKLMALLNRGELFDKDAFQELQGIASGTNGTTNIAPLAKAMFNKLQRTLLIDRAQDGRVIINSEAFGSLTSDEIADALETAKSPELDAIVNTMGKQPLFVSRLVELAHQSKDLWTINRIAKSLNEMTGVNFYPWDLQPLNNWWARNSSKYTNWPVEHFRNALQEVASAHYQAALTNFEFVVAIDPTADKSRALAVGCAIEVGNMSKAQQLNTNFAIANGRWEHWARGKMMLATNAVRQGTEEFVSLAKKYPGFVGDGLIHEGNHVLRQVDWPLYRELMVATTNTASGNTNAAP